MAQFSNGLSLKTLFIGFGFLYLSGLLVTPNLAALAIMFSYILFFIAGWKLTNKRINIRFLDKLLLFSQNDAIYTLKLFYCIFFILCIVGLVKVNQVGWENYFFVTRSARALLTRSDFLLSVFDDLLVSFFLAITAIIYHHQIRRNLLYYLIICILFALSILSISLSSTMLLVISLILTSRSNINFSRWFIPFLFIGIILSTFWKPLLGSLILGYNFTLTDFKYPAEFTTWINLYQNINGEGISNYFNNYLLGLSFYKSFVSILLPFYDYESLSVTYAKNYFPEVYRAGGGRGFSLPMEAYINFGFFGPPFISFFWGILFKFISLKAPLNAYYLFIYLSIAGIIFKFFRSETLAIFKNLVWLQIVPISVSFLFAGITIFLIRCLKN